MPAIPFVPTRPLDARPGTARRRHPIRMDRERSRQRRVDHDVRGDPECALVSVSLAVKPELALQGAANVVLRVDDGPVAVDLDAFESRMGAAAPGRLGVLDDGEV